MRPMRAAAARTPGADIRPDRDVVFAAAVGAGVVLGAALVRTSFSPKRKWGPRRGPAGAFDACVRHLGSVLQE